MYNEDFTWYVPWFIYSTVIDVHKDTLLIVQVSVYCNIYSTCIVQEILDMYPGLFTVQ